MIFLLDDDRFNERSKYAGPSIDSGAFEDVLKLVSGMSSNAETKGILNEFSCFLVHESTEDIDDSGSRVAGSFLAVTDLLDHLMVQHVCPKPYAIFSGGHGRVKMAKHGITEIPKHIFYSNLVHFLQHYREQNEIDLRFIADGPRYKYDEIKEAADPILAALRNLESDEPVNIDNLKLELRDLNRFFTLAKTPLTPEDTIAALRQKHPTRQVFESRIKEIIQSMK